jgi:hypothetical protein
MGPAARAIGTAHRVRPATGPMGNTNLAATVWDTSLIGSRKPNESLVFHPAFISRACARDGGVARVPRSQPCSRSR